MADKLTNRKQTTTTAGDEITTGHPRAGRVLLCGAGLWLALPTPYRERTYVFNADGCRLETTIVEKQQGGSQGAVLLFHGIPQTRKSCRISRGGLPSRVCAFTFRIYRDTGAHRGRFLRRARNSAGKRFSANCLRLERSLPTVRFWRGIRWVGHRHSSSCTSAGRGSHRNIPSTDGTLTKSHQRWCGFPGLMLFPSARSLSTVGWSSPRA